MVSVAKLIDEAFDTITPEKWNACVEHVMKREQEMMEIDHIADEFFDNPTQFVINLEDDSDEDEDDVPDEWVSDNDELFEQPLEEYENFEEEEVDDPEDTLAMPLDE
ncbi:uncharacterized protein LOC127750355 [Frankliniella occidentalis]|uniref:Uncharacterized protein LOC127750355 n=1 Tax=Frankliniella occidentalis TaxID=133901 RepID=A0A9C6X271_FRAOC|nr:uncharacterized protein LOC127750355 [Frankliniella occidentalis]